MRERTKRRGIKLRQRGENEGQNEKERDIVEAKRRECGRKKCDGMWKG